MFSNVEVITISNKQLLILILIKFIFSVDGNLIPLILTSTDRDILSLTILNFILIECPLQNNLILNILKLWNIVKKI